MSVLSEEDVANELADDTKRAIVRYCREARSSAEIIKHVESRSQDKYARDYWERVVSNNLVRLEKLKILAFSLSKWKSTPNALSVLEKFFGGQ